MYYNLLMRTGEWKNQSSYKYYSSRFLEYTEDEIKEEFYKDFERIKELPCLFMYEYRGSKSRKFHLGTLTEIKEVDNIIEIQYEILKDFDDFFKEEEDDKYIEFLEDLGVKEDTWESSRTHWAIKKVDDLNDIFRKYSLDADNLDLENKTEKVTNPKSKELEKKETKIKTISEFLEEITEISGKIDLNENEIFYRGHSKISYEIEPSVLRKDKYGTLLYLQDENKIFSELLVSNSEEFISDKTTFDKLVRMQHYGLPTRLLDITSNPLIALYFACKGKEEKDGKVIIFEIKRENIKYFDSDTVSCISNLCRLIKEERDAIYEYMLEKDFNDKNEIKRLISFIKEEKPYFEPKIKENDLTKIVCVKAKKNNSRISFQSGAFLLFGLESDIETDLEIKKYEIEIENKEEILKDLNILNINESTVFPYIENSAKYIADKCKEKRS